ncbi:MAG TPA: TadE family protein [Micromonospora sp.]
MPTADLPIGPAGSGDRRPDGPDRGATPVELAILMPVILVLLFASIQFAAVYLARAVALSAAQQGVTAQRVHGAEPGDGVARATEFLRGAGDWLTGWDSPGPVCVSTPAGAPTEVQCTVSGHALSVVPFLDFEVRQTAHGTVERFTVG